jgi:hypothetical protein
MYTEPRQPKNITTALDQLRAQGRLQPGGVTMVSAAHDDWCAPFQGAVCNGAPDVPGEGGKHAAD